ncbi:hypothetical protein FIBSPDRAFT_960975 [Athelia psychrophila]|uniref:Uncharacterized protein n=1 Tax=Athelia psychrophila TaxID=1759441 RepID=A0A166BRH8_9AGAM|nr:hypothetical protein FIBSPDRAFT_960975 [Fibularhizoctonia sp. CBS 109695]
MSSSSRPKADTVPIKGKNIVILGNSCSGMQLVPAQALIAQNIIQFPHSLQFYFPYGHLAVHWLLFSVIERSFGQLYTTLSGDQRCKKQKVVSGVEKTPLREYWELLKPSYKVGCKRQVYDPGCILEDSHSLHSTNT